MALNPTAEKILSAYLRICTTEGVGSATLQKAAAAARVPFSTAHYHLGKRPDYWIEWSLERVGGRAQDYIASHLERSAAKGQDPIRAYIDGTFGWISAAGREASLWLYFYYHVSVRADRRRRHEAFIRTARERVLRLLFEAHGKGAYPGIAPDLALAGAVHALVFGNGIQAITLGTSSGIEELRRSTHTAIARLLRD